MSIKMLMLIMNIVMNHNQTVILKTVIMTAVMMKMMITNTFLIWMKMNKQKLKNLKGKEPKLYKIRMKIVIMKKEKPKKKMLFFGIRTHILPSIFASFIANIHCKHLHIY